MNFMGPRAVGCLDSQRVLFCRLTQLTFLRLLTTAAVVSPFGIPPLSNQAARSLYETFRGNSRIGWADEPNGLDATWKKLASVSQPAPKLWMDTYLAAFALSGGYRLMTTDRAFKQFKGLEVQVLGKN